MKFAALPELKPCSREALELELKRFHTWQCGHLNPLPSLNTPLTQVKVASVD